MVKLEEVALVRVPLALLHPSPTNPRKTFDPVKLDELAASIRGKDILEPLLCRPHPKKAEEFEIVAGERRYRAAKLAEIETAPCIIKPLSDIEVLEIQTIENLQRDDVHPLEEADGYAALMKKGKYSEEQIAERIGKTVAYVRDRLQLVQLAEPLRPVFMDGEIGVGHAVILARLDEEDQLRVAGWNPKLERLSDHSGLFHATQGHAAHMQAEIVGVEGQRSRKAVSIRELQTYVDDHVRFRPEQAELADLFPETFQAVAHAEEEELKVIYITRDHQLKPETREKGRRVYSVRSWKRADGQPEPNTWGGSPKASKTCQHSVLGVVVTGPGRGQSFLVCIEKKKCKTHWGEEQRAAKKRAEGGARDTSYEEEQRKREERWEREKAERARWEAARGQIMAAVTEKLADVDAMKILAPYLLNERGDLKPPFTIETADDLVRALAWQDLRGRVGHAYTMEATAKLLKKLLGLNAKKIVDEVSPRPRAPRKKKAAKKAAKKSTTTTTEE